MPEPSTKNGRRSLKNVSNAERLTTAGSASTWPKSGLTVALRVNPGVTAYFMSMPADPPRALALSSGFPPVRCRSRLATVYGVSSRPLTAPIVERPPSSPKDDT